jgi:hypothetical protein
MAVLDALEWRDLPAARSYYTRHIMSCTHTDELGITVPRNFVTAATTKLNCAHCNSLDGESVREDSENTAQTSKNIHEQS